MKTFQSRKSLPIWVASLSLLLMFLFMLILSEREPSSSEKLGGNRMNANNDKGEQAIAIAATATADASPIGGSLTQTIPFAALTVGTPTDANLPVKLDLSRVMGPGDSGKPSNILSLRPPRRLEALFDKEVGDEVLVEFTRDFSLMGKMVQKAQQPGTDTLAITIQNGNSTLHLEKERPGDYRGSIVHRRSTVAHRISTSDKGFFQIEQIAYSEMICAPAGATPEKAAGLPVLAIPEDQPDFEFEPLIEEVIVPDFDSFPSATAVIYLDFDGHVTTGTQWNSLRGIATINTAPSSVGTSGIQEVCRRVAEDFSPFNISVTTSLTRYESAPPARRIRVVITPDSSWWGGDGGVAYVGSFRWSGDTPCWVFEDNLGSSIKYIAEAASHEVGHTFDLKHDGKLPAGNDTGGNGAYYYGVDNSSVSWGPIMGVGYYSNFTQWSKGEYAGATNTEDDLAIISSSTNGFGYRLDDKGGTTASASSLAFQGGSSASVLDAGIIEKNTDIDMMRFTCSAGTVSLTISPDGTSPNLFLKAELLDASGNVLLSRSATKNSPLVTLSMAVTAGDYYLKVQGTGMGVPVGSVPPYAYDASGYGSLGKYSVSGSVPAASSVPSLAVNTDAISQTTTVGINPVNQAFSVRNAGGQSISYVISESIPWLSVLPTSGSSSGASVSHTISYNTTGLAAGSYSGVITVTAAGVAGSPKTINVNLTINATGVVPPTGLAASDGTFSDKVMISWNAVSGASSYELHRSNINFPSDATLIASTSATNYDDTSAQAGVGYFYWVKVVKSGLTSGFSDYDSGFRGVVAGNNDVFANRASLTGSTATVTSDNRSASKETSEPAHGGNSGGRSLWWSWTAPANGTLTVDTIGSDFDTTLGVYTGTTVAALTTRGSDDDSAGNQSSRVQLQVTTGTSYAIAVDGYNAASGTIRLNLNFVASAQLPSPPEAVAASDGSQADRVRVSWSAGAGAASYDVRRHTSSQFSSSTLLGNVTGLSFDDTTAAAGTTYYYWVVSRNSAGTSTPAGPDSGYRSQSISNDSFASRTALTGISVAATGDNRQASKETGEPAHSNNSGGKSLWWNWTAPSNGTLTVDTIGSDFDTTLGVYTGTTVSALTTRGSNDDSGGNLTSRVQLQVTAGTSYAIAVDGYNGASGTVSLNLNFLASALPPSPPEAVAATDGTLPDRVRVTWNAAAGAASYDVRRHTSSQFSSSILLGNVTGQSFDDTTAAVATTYYYWVVSRNSAGTSTPAGPDSGNRSQSAFNDTFANRTQLTGSTATVTGDNRPASKETGEPAHAGNSGGRSLWWSWTAPANGTLTVDTIGSDFDTTLGVYTGTTVSALTTRGSNDDSGGNQASRVQLQVTAGTSYVIAVDGYNGDSGTVRLNLVFESAASSNDSFANRAALTGNTAAVTGDNRAASKETGEPAHGGNSGGKSLWWIWTATSNGALTVDTIGSNVDTTLGVYTGTTVSSLTTRGSDDDSGGNLTSRVQLQVTAGTSYAIAVDGYNGDSGTVRLNLNFVASASSNDSFANRAALTGNTAAVTGDNRAASKETGEPAHGGNSGGRSLWWSWTATSNGALTVETIGSSFDTTLGVYTGTTVSALTTRGSDDDSGGNQTSRVQLQVTAGTSYVIAVDGFNGASGTVNLNLVFSLGTPPVITSHPSSLLINSGAMASLSVVASGSPPFDYQWYHGNSGNTSNPVAGAILDFFTTPALTVTSNYWVRVSNSAGSSDSNSAVIEVMLGQFHVGNQVVMDLNRFLTAGETIKIVGKLPTGLKFNATTGLISGIITGKPGTYSLSVQVFQGRTLLRTAPLSFTVEAFPSSLIGNFEFLLEDENDQPRGAFRLTITKANQWSATLETVGASRRSAKGSFILAEGAPVAPISAVFPATIGAAAATVNISIDGSASTLTGTYNEGTLRGFRIASAGETPLLPVTCNLVFDAGVQDGITVPAGLGWMTGKVSNLGVGTFKGLLGDGTAASLTLSVSASGQAVLWSQPYNNKNSYIGGIVTLGNLGQPVSNNPTLTDGVWWTKAADGKTLSYPDGFPAMPVFIGTSKWIAPATATALGASLGWRDNRTAAVMIDGGGLSNEEPQTTSAALPTEFTLDDKFNLAASAPATSPRVAWKGNVAKTDSAFSGTLTLPAGFSTNIPSGSAAVSGVLIQDGSWGSVTGCGLIKVPASGVKGSFRTAAIVLDQ